MNKYRSKKVYIDGIKFDSIKESQRYLMLLDMQKQGVIYNLQLQVPFTLIEKQLNEKGKVLERAVVYKADFVYTDKQGKKHVEDTKGIRTPEYIIKRKLMLKIHNIQIEEI